MTWRFLITPGDTPSTRMLWTLEHHMVLPRHPTYIGDLGDLAAERFVKEMRGRDMPVEVRSTYIAP